MGDIAPEAWAPLGTILVALIGVLGAMLVRERRRNGNHGNPGNPGNPAPVDCPYATGRAKVALTTETLAALTNGMDSIKAEAAGLRTLQGKVLDAITNQAGVLAVILDRGGRQKPGGEQ